MIDSMLFGRNVGCTKRFYALSDTELLSICDINHRTLYKLCKKIDKKLVRDGEESAKKWYKWVCDTNAYKFLGCRELDNIKLNITPVECPICFEKVTGSNSYIPKCSHICCKECANHWHNVKHTCPLCRVTV